MSPASWPQQQPGAGAARHAAAFKVHRDSHSIHKQATSSLSSGSTNSSVSSSSNGAIITSSSGHHHHQPAPAPPPPPPRRPQQQQPVIIYTHSPKVIRTNPRDFMSIVQKLTGLDSHGGRGAPPPPAPGRINSVGSVVITAPPQDESSSSSSESCANNNAHAVGPPPPYADWQLMPPPPPALAAPMDAHFVAPDIPLLFAPDATASDLQQLYAPRGLYGQFPPVDAAAAEAIGPVMSTNMNSAGSNGGAVFSPSMVEAMRTFSGYN